MIAGAHGAVVGAQGFSMFRIAFEIESGRVAVEEEEGEDPAVQAEGRIFGAEGGVLGRLRQR